MLLGMFGVNVVPGGSFLLRPFVLCDEHTITFMLALRYGRRVDSVRSGPDV